MTPESPTVLKVSLMVYRCKGCGVLAVANEGDLCVSCTFKHGVESAAERTKLFSVWVKPWQAADDWVLKAQHSSKIEVVHAWTRRGALAKVRGMYLVQAKGEPIDGWDIRALRAIANCNQSMMLDEELSPVFVVRMGRASILSCAAARRKLRSGRKPVVIHA